MKTLLSTLEEEPNKRKRISRAGKKSESDLLPLPAVPQKHQNNTLSIYTKDQVHTNAVSMLSDLVSKPIRAMLR